MQLVNNADGVSVTKILFQLDIEELQCRLNSTVEQIFASQYDSKINADSLIREYRKNSRLLSLYLKAIYADWEKFDWVEADRLGWFCKKDYEIFPELSNLNPKTWLQRAKS